jgi:ABC-2 type transport system ATP-binding protein
MSVELAIASQGLTRTFGNLVAVDHLDLEVPRACIYGFLGPNGCGKSTTIRMLCGLLTPSSGGAEVLGVEVPRHAERLRSRIGYMTQRFSLYEDLSVQENLAFLARIYSLPRARARLRVKSQMEVFGLVDRSAQLAGTLSGGQRQRLALAAATLHEPELLFLDEPTSAVDPESRREFWEFLFEMVDQGTTVLVSTHFMDEAERCHALAILDQGRLVASGEPQQLMRDIGATVVEIESDDIRRAREMVMTAPMVMHVAQLGTRLHALVDPSLQNPEGALNEMLTNAGVSASLRPVGANLEDVFVMSTGSGPQ